MQCCAWFVGQSAFIRSDLHNCYNTSVRSGLNTSVVITRPITLLQGSQNLGKNSAFMGNVSGRQAC